MPLKFAPFDVTPATRGDECRLVGIIFNLPTDLEIAAGEKPSVTWKFKALDTAGKTVGEKEFSETLARIQAEDATSYGIIAPLLKEHGYGHAKDAGFPAGGALE